MTHKKHRVCCIFDCPCKVGTVVKKMKIRILFQKTFLPIVIYSDSWCTCTHLTLIEKLETSSLLKRDRHKSKVGTLMMFLNIYVVFWLQYVQKLWAAHWFFSRNPNVKSYPVGLVFLNLSPDKVRRAKCLLSCNVFESFFFGAGSWLKFKQRIQKMVHLNKCLSHLILSGL